MKNSSIVIPVILVLCLVALGLLVSQALSASKNDQAAPEDTSIYSELPNTSAADSPSIAEDQAPAAADTTRSGQRFSDLVPASSADSPVIAREGEAGSFLIIAGTFRQVINARTRVRDLKSAGFNDTTLENFDRGTFAVALVNRTGTYAEAEELARRVRSAGFEVEIYRKR